MAKKRGRPLMFARRFNFMISREQDAALTSLYQRDGVSPSEAARRALTAYLTQKGVLKPASKPMKKKRSS